MISTYPIMRIGIFRQDSRSCTEELIVVTTLSCRRGMVVSRHAQDKFEMALLARDLSIAETTFSIS